MRSKIFSISILIIAAVLVFQTAHASVAPTVPSGSQTYTVSQPSTVWPKILQATINPPDVHVGMSQQLGIVLEDDATITVVDAIIQTDHGSTTLPLKLNGQANAQALAPQKYAVDGNNQLVALGSNNNALVSVAEADLAKLSYSGIWTVADTHNTYYKTTFLVEDSLGRKNTITLDWSDACGIPASGSATISSNCQESSMDGVNGNLTITTSTTLTLNSEFVITPGNALTIHGALVMGSGGSLVFQTIDCSGSSTPGTTRTMYSYEDVSCGIASLSQSQTCQATGAWSGTYTLTSPPQASTATYYSDLTSSCGTYGSGSETVTCQSNGNFNNAYPYLYSSAPAVTTAVYYSANTSACGTYGYSSQTASCQSNGSFNNTYSLTSAPAASTRSMYAAASVCGGSCSSQTQTCQSSGSFSGTYTNASCSMQTPTTWYEDLDGEGDGDAAVTEQACTQPAGYVATADCPGVGGFYSVPDSYGNWNYTCTGVIVKQYYIVGGCQAVGISNCGGSGSCGPGNDGACQYVTDGWYPSAPACGASGLQLGPDPGTGNYGCFACNYSGYVTESCD